MRTLVFSLLVLAGCTKAGDPTDTAPTQTPTVPSTPAAAPIPKSVPKPQSATRVELTAVTLADDCGGTAPATTPGPAAGASAKREARARADMMRRCEQTSMQLAIIADGSATLRVKSVELFDETGKSLGTLTASKPTRWSETTSVYEAWDEAFTAGSRTNVSYVLTQPNWDHVANRMNKTFTLKAVLTIDGVDQTAQKNVTLTAPTSLPPNVRT